MRIENHLLVGDGAVDLSHRPAPNRRFPLNPTMVCIHYDVCHSIDMNADAQFASGLFYHVAVDAMDRDDKVPEVRQYTPFNRRGSHAKGFNDRAIGLVIVNPGPLVRSGSGELKTTYGRAWDPDDAVEARHWHPNAPKEWTHWAAYSHEERDVCIDICRLLLAEYPSIKKICGHDQLSPGRKSDPGPAAETAIMAYLRAAFPNVEVPGGDE